jgi:DNA-directed RNA polymerase subunit RPC12/RpoP
VIKFRCQRCSQKIAVDDEVVGVVIDCPSCAESMIVPPRSDREFIPGAGDALSLELVPEPPPVERAWWSRAIIERLLPALLAQRRELLQNQDAAAEQLAGIEQRILLLKMKFERRLSYYRERVATLEAEKRELMRQASSAQDDGAAQVRSFSVGRVSLRDAGFLLRM